MRIWDSTLKFDTTWNRQDAEVLICISIVYIRRIGGYGLPRRHVKHESFSFVFCVFFLSLCISTHSIPERPTMPSTERERKSRREERERATWRNIEFLVLVVYMCLTYLPWVRACLSVSALVLTHHLRKTTQVPKIHISWPAGGPFLLWCAAWSVGQNWPFLVYYSTT